MFHLRCKIFFYTKEHLTVIQLNFVSLIFSVFLVMSLIMVGLTGIAFYDIPSLKLEDYLSQNRDLYLSNSQLCGPDIEKIDEEEENLIEK